MGKRNPGAPRSGAHPQPEHQNRTTANTTRHSTSTHRTHRDERKLKQHPIAFAQLRHRPRRSTPTASSRPEESPRRGPSLLIFNPQPDRPTQRVGGWASETPEAAQRPTPATRTSEPNHHEHPTALHLNAPNPPDERRGAETVPDRVRSSDTGHADRSRQHRPGPKRESTPSAFASDLLIRSLAGRRNIPERRTRGTPPQRIEHARRTTQAEAVLGHARGSGASHAAGAPLRTPLSPELPLVSVPHVTCVSRPRRLDRIASDPRSQQATGGAGAGGRGARPGPWFG